MNAYSSTHLQKAAARKLAIVIAFLAAVAISAFAPTHVWGIDRAYAADDSNALTVGNIRVSAQSAIQLTEKNLWTGNTNDVFLETYFEDDIYGVYEEMKIVKVTSSNAAVLKVSGSGSLVSGYDVYPVKAGTAKLTVTYKLNGEKSTVSKTYTVNDYESGIESMSLNGNGIAVLSANNPSTEGYYFQFKGAKAKLNITVADGWSLGKIRGKLTGTSKSKASKSQLKKAQKELRSIQNEQAFTIPAGTSANIFINVKNPEGKSFPYTLHVVRFPPLQLYNVTSEDLENGLLFINHPKTVQVDYVGYIASQNKYKGLKTVSVKSSNPKAIKVLKNANPRKIKLQAKKAGSSTITVKYTWQGRTYTTSAKYISQTYPLKSIAVNGKKLNLAKESSGYTFSKFSKSSATIKATPAKGWKLKSITSSGKTLKNGGSLKTPKGKSTQAYIVLAKGKYTFGYYIYFSRY